MKNLKNIVQGGFLFFALIYASATSGKILQNKSPFVAGSAWHPSCLKKQCPLKNSAYGDCTPSTLDPSTGKGTREKHISLTSRDVATLKDVAFEEKSPQLSLKDFPPEASLMVTTEAQNFSSGIASDLGGGGMDLFGIRGMWVSPNSPSLTSDYYGSSPLHYL